MNTVLRQSISNGYGGIDKSGTTFRTRKKIHIYYSLKFLFCIASLRILHNAFRTVIATLYIRNHELVTEPDSYRISATKGLIALCIFLKICVIIRFPFLVVVSILLFPMNALAALHNFQDLSYS